MSALFQSLSTELGRAGGGYATARDAATEERNKAKVDSFNLALSLRQQLQSEQVQKALQEVRERQLKSQEAGNILDLGVSQTPDGKWVHMMHNLASGKTVSIPLEGPPASVVTAEENRAATDARVRALEEQREQDRQADIKSRYEDQSQLARLRAKLGLGGPDDFSFIAPYIESGALKLKGDVQPKNIPSLVKWMTQHNMKIPNQLSDAVNDKLTQRLDTLQSFDKLITDMMAKGPDGKSELDLLADTRNQVTVQLIRSAKEGSVTSLAALKLMPKSTVDRLSKLTADLDSGREMVNVIRSPLGASGFRGKEGMEMIQGTMAQPFGPVGVNMAVLKRTQDLVRRLEAGTSSILGGGDFESTPASTPAANSKPRFVKDPKTGEMVEQ